MRQLMRSEIGPWTIVIALAIFMAICAVPANCQSTTISATVVDKASTVWANGTWQLQFVPNPNYPSNNVNWNGNPFPTSQWSYSGNLDNSGAFSQSDIPSNNFINPSGSTYTLTVCPNATSACTVITSLSIQGSTLNFSSIITAASPAPVVKPLPFGRAYNDNEVTPIPSNVGYFYMNTTSDSPRYWGQDQAFHAFLSGVSSFSAGNLPPLFTTSVGSDPANPSLAFTLSNAAANKVFANCSTSTAPPSYCSLTAAMIPALPYLPASTTIYYQNLHNPPGTPQPQEPIFTFGAEFNTTDTPGVSTLIDLANSGVAAGTYNCANVTVDIFGRVTTIAAGTCGTAQVIRTATVSPGCTTPAGGPTGNSCSDTLTWSGGGFVDTNYRVTCSGGTPFTSGSTSEANAVDLIGWGTKTTTTINTATVSKGSDGSAQFGTIDCIGVHN